MKAVADTGPLIHLAEIDCLPFLSIFDNLHIPRLVWNEALSPPTIKQELRGYTLHHLDDHDITKFVLDHSLNHLQTADCHALRLCGRLDVETLLTDDLAVRKAAKKLGITAVGSIGIILRAHRLGRLSTSRAMHLFKKLELDSSLFITAAVTEIAIQKLLELESRD